MVSIITSNRKPRIFKDLEIFTFFEWCGYNTVSCLYWKIGEDTAIEFKDNKPPMCVEFDESEECLVIDVDINLIKK